MYYYRLGYSFCKDENIIILQHAQSFTSAEWQARLTRSYQKVVPQLIALEQQKDPHASWIVLPEVVDAVIQYLVTHEGFQSMVYCQGHHASVGGSYLMDWTQSYPTFDTPSIINYQLQLLANHNEQVSLRIDQENEEILKTTEREVS